MNTKNRSTPVVEKKEDKKEETCGCGCKDCSCDSENSCGCKDCACGCGCGCKCNCGDGALRTILKCGTILFSAFLIAGAIFYQPSNMPKRYPTPMRPTAPNPVLTEKAMRKFVENNPELLIETVDKYYKAKEAAAVKNVQAKAEPREFKLENLPKADESLVKQIINDKTNYSLGNKNGKFVIIEFFDYNCGWCKRTNKGLEEAIAKPEGKNIRWIPIDTPIFGEGSETIARYVLAAGEQGKYAEMHAAVGAATGRLDEDALLELGKGLKLDTKKLKAAANGNKIKAKLESNNEFRDKLNIRGVPMLIVDGRINGGALIGENLDAVVKISSQK
ncbi:MAG: DsbA family protein [Pseudomonadota bacterium]|nr:DsbA family protein [Pseudomonadota bacterium]